jgi:hypothetical protein
MLSKLTVMLNQNSFKSHSIITHTLLLKCSSGNSRTLVDGVTDLGFVEQHGRFLQPRPEEEDADRFFLITRFRVSSDLAGAFNPSRSDGSLPVLVGPACVLSLSVSDTLPATATGVRFTRRRRHIETRPRGNHTHIGFT